MGSVLVPPGSNESGVFVNNDASSIGATVVGLFVPSSWGAPPITVPANVFEEFVLVTWGCTVSVANHSNNSVLNSVVALVLNGADVTNSVMGGGMGYVREGTEQDGSGRAVSAPCSWSQAFLIADADAPLAAQPTIARSLPFILNMRQVSQGSAGETMTQPWMYLMGK